MPFIVHSAARRRLALGAMAMAAATLATATQAANFSFSAGFPGANPVVGLWNYMERGTVNPTATILSNLTTSPYVLGGCALNSPCWGPIWTDPTQVNQVPSFGANNSKMDRQSYGTCCQAFALPKKCLFVHPGRTEDAIVRFTVPPKPGGGSYTVAQLIGTITDQDFNGGSGVNWTVELNTAGVPGFSGTLLSTPGNISSTTFPSTALTVATGDTIDIVVNAVGNNEYFDTTAVCGSISLS